MYYDYIRGGARRGNYKLRKVLAICGIIFVAVIAVLADIGLSFNDTEYTITVTDKSRPVRVTEDGIRSQYMVWGDAPDGTPLVFENKDCLIRGKINSSNIQGQLKVGKTYKVTVVGIRFALKSMYQNIIKVEEVTN